MSFGRRLALFFLLIVLVPTAALIGILLFVSEDSRRGKADARLAAGIETAVAVHGDGVAAAQQEARELAQNPALGRELASGEAASLQRLARESVASGSAVRVEISDLVGEIAAAGQPDAVAFAQVDLTQGGRPAGALRVSTTTADQYAESVRRLTQRDLIVSRDQEPLAATVTPPAEDPLEPDETEDLEVDGREFRGREIVLNQSDRETLLLLGPRKEGGVLGIGPATGILIWFLVVAMVLAWALARTLTRLHDRVAEQAITDPLTGLWNRRYMGETFDREVSRALRFGHEISLIILDVDDFKRINDRQGHLQGDLVLETVADIVRDATRTIDVAARYGGDEIALILVETGRGGAATLAERLRERARETEIEIREGDGGTMRVTLSLGVATIPDSADDLESLVDAADRALLRAKRAGKDRIRTAPPMRRQASGRRTGPRGSGG